MKKHCFVVAILLFAIFSPLMISSVLAYEETGIYQSKTPTRILLQFQATKQVFDNISSIADSRYEVTKTPTSWAFSTDDSDHYMAYVHIDYGNVTVMQTLLFALYSGGELTEQRYIEIIGTNVTLKLDVFTGEPESYPTTEELVQDLTLHLRGEIADLTVSMTNAVRTMDSNVGVVILAVIGQTIAILFIILVLVTLTYRNETIRSWIRKELGKIAQGPPGPPGPKGEPGKSVNKEGPTFPSVKRKSGGKWFWRLLFFSLSVAIIVLLIQIFLEGGFNFG